MDTTLPSSDSASAVVQSVQLEVCPGGQSVSVHRPFDPLDYDLEASFRLTRRLLEGLKSVNASHDGLASSHDSHHIHNHINHSSNESHQQYFHQEMGLPKIGIGMDCAVIPIRHGGLVLIQTVDYFYPLVDDPYIMGKITCANVLSDLYAMGVTDCDNMLMILGVSQKMTEKERDVVVPIIMRGFRDTAFEAGTQITGGQTVINPWLTIGGVATSICQPTEYIIPDNAVVGDVLVLTKPLGTQVSSISYQWLEQSDKWSRIKLVVTEDDVRKAYLRGMDSMSRLNRIASRLMHKYNAHGATDVTGFGLLGHAQNLAKVQKNEVSFAAAYCKDIEKQEGYQAWIIGIVEKGNRSARIIDKPRVIEVPAKEKDGELW
ncbi:unnamed protein product, partial [Medioppia subpectinata]